MKSYLIFFIICQTLLCFSLKLEPNLRRSTLIIVLILMWLFSGLNGGKGADYNSYKNIYELNEPFYNYWEFLFYGFINLCNFLKLSFIEFIIIINLLYSIIIYFLLLKINKPILFLSIYIAGFYLYFQFNAIRQGISVLIFLLVILSEKNTYKYILAFMSIGLHLTQLMTTIIYKISINLKIYLLIILAPIFLLIISKYSAYIENNVIESNKLFFPILFLKGIFVLWAIKIHGNKVLALVMTLIVLFSHLGLLYISRYSDVIFIILVMLICNYHLKFTKKQLIVIVAMIISLQIGSLKIIYDDCSVGSNIWCEY